MTLDDFRKSLPDDGPPAGLSRALEALWHVANGAWDVAHKLVQSGSGQDRAWVHAHLHRIDGDYLNAVYWYRRAGRPNCGDLLEQEWADITENLLSSHQ